LPNKLNKKGNMSAVPMPQRMAAVLACAWGVLIMPSRGAERSKLKYASAYMLAPVMKLAITVISCSRLDMIDPSFWRSMALREKETDDSRDALSPACS
jgi:hypothetical protein